MLLATVVLWVYFLRVDIHTDMTNQTITGNATVLDTTVGQLFLMDDRDDTILLHTRSYNPVASMLSVGDTVTLTATIDSTAQEYQHYLISGGVKVMGTLTHITINDHPPYHFYGKLHQRRAELCDSLYNWQSTEEMALLQSLLFSNKNHLSDQTKSNFSQSGMSHLMSVSGLHISILLFSILALLQVVHFPKKLQFLCLSMIGGLLFVLAGMSPSIFRGLCMVLFSTLATAIGRRNDAITILTLSAISLIAICPPILMNLSFLLSHIATLGILLFSPKLVTYGKVKWLSHFPEENKIVNWFLAGVAIPISAQILTAPIIAIAFGEISMIGMMINLVAIPLCYPVLLFGFVGTFFFSVGLAPVGGVFLHIAMFFASILSKIARLGAAFPFATVDIHTIQEALMLIVICLATSVLLYHPWRMKKWDKPVMVILLLLPISVLGLWLEKNNSTTVVSSTDTGSVLVYGQHDSILITGSTSNYHRELDIEMCEQYTDTHPQNIVLTDPLMADKHIKAWVDAIPSDYYTLTSTGVQTLTIGEPVPLWIDCQLVATSPYSTEIWVDDIKIVKYWGNYGTMTSSELDAHHEIVIDRTGNMIAINVDNSIYRNQQRSTIRFLNDT